jgi:hypothetical protein
VRESSLTTIATRRHLDGTPKGQRKMETRVVAAGCGTPKESTWWATPPEGVRITITKKLAVVLKAHETREATVAATVF